MSNIIMDGTTDQKIAYADARTVCRHATPCPRVSWASLLDSTYGSKGESLARYADEYSATETEGILFALAQAVEQRDRQTAGHCRRLAYFSVALGVGLGLDRSSLMALFRGGYMHDVGKVGIPDSILFKPGKLDADEWVIMRSHPIRGEEICRHLKSLGSLLPVIRHHHERWDGSGYPDGLRGEEIPLTARVLQVADIFDALTSPRPYKPAYTPARALAILQEETDRGWRDPAIVELFMSMYEDVISKIAVYDFRPDRELVSLRESLDHLQTFLAGK